MYLTTKSGRKIYLPSKAEDAAITAAALSDPDAQPLTDAAFAKAKRVGRPLSNNPKQHTNLRLSPATVNAFRATGKGWQTRIDAALKDWLKTHNPADLTPPPQQP